MQLQSAVHDEADLDFKTRNTQRLETAAVLLLDSAGAAVLRKAAISPYALRSMAVGVIGRRMGLGTPSLGVRNWYLADAALLEGRHDFLTGRKQLSDARDAFPRDARVLMASGSVLETEGEKLDDAAEYYRASIALDPSNAQCRLRLARVLLLRGNAAGSLAELDRMAEPADDRIAYLRELFRASALAALKRPPDAEKKFIDALRWNAQAPYLGLAESMAARGDDAGARKVIARLLAAGVEEDPWASYLRGQWRYFPELIEEARRAIK